MSEHPRTGLWVLAAALLLGALGDMLFWPGANGVNVLLWLAAGAACAALTVRGLRLAGPRARLPLAAPALFFAALVAWRDSAALQALDFGAIAVALSLPMWRPAAGHPAFATLGDGLAGLKRFGHEAGLGAVDLVLRDVPWATLKGSGWGKRAALVGRGAALALGPLLLFGGLFVMADAGFEATVTKALAIDPVTLLAHGWAIVLCAWGAAGLLRGTLGDHAANPAAVPAEAPEKWRIGLVELTIVLGAVDLLFAAFVWHQLPWLFGGMEAIARTQGLLPADYARRGFFELSIVGGLTLPMLLALRWLMGAAPGVRQRRAYTALGGTLLGLLIVIVASAAHRMGCYFLSFGLTELRVFVMAFEVWMVGLVGWFAATVLRERPRRFVSGAVAWGFVGVFALHVPNLEALIVRTNVERGVTREACDVRYLVGLSDDAVPALAAALPKMKPWERAVAQQRVQEAAHRELDWRSWNLSRHLARGAVGSLPLPMQAMGVL